jgi:hypothetical protein
MRAGDATLVAVILLAVIRSAMVDMGANKEPFVAVKGVLERAI